MKKIILILAIATTLSCEKTNEYKEYTLTVVVENKLKNGEQGKSPNGWGCQYIENGEVIKKQGDYAGIVFQMYWNNTQPLYIEAESKTDAMILIQVYMPDTDKPWIEKLEYKKAIIDM